MWSRSLKVTKPTIYKYYSVHCQSNHIQIFYIFSYKMPYFCLPKYLCRLISRNCPRLYLRNLQSDRADITTAEFRAQDNPMNQIWAKCEGWGCNSEKKFVDLSWNAPAMPPTLKWSNISCGPFPKNESFLSQFSYKFTNLYSTCTKNSIF